MTIVYAKHDPYWDTGHLGDVIEEMHLAGPPTIRVMKYQNKLFALEGSHRLAACFHIGLIPKVIILEPDTEGCEDFLDKIISTLPIYEFEYVLKLEEAAFL